MQTPVTPSLGLPSEAADLSPVWPIHTHVPLHAHRDGVRAALQELIMPAGSRSSSASFRGCFTAVITPFAADGSAIDFVALQHQLERQAEGKVTGVVLSGTTGESPTLEEHEFAELISRGIEIGKRLGLMMLVGTGSNYTAHAIHLQKLAHKAGADAALCVNPYYNKPTQEGLYRHFGAVADSCDLPIMLYNIPGRTAGGLTFETIQRLASHPNIKAIKDAAGNVDFTSQTCAACPNLAVLSGDDPLTLPMMSVGAVGVVSVLSNVVPDRVSGLCRLALAGNFGAAREAHHELAPLTRALFLETNPIPLKAAMRLMGLDSGALRLPMTEAAPTTVERLREALAKQELLRPSGTR
jgi:4-hydroxy-tetrahydrodipicolinate synthase